MLLGNKGGKLSLHGKRSVEFEEEKNMVFHTDEKLLHHSNGMRFTAFNKSEEIIYSKVYYSVGGGFVFSEEEISGSISPKIFLQRYPFKNAKEILIHCVDKGWNISKLIR